MAKVEAPNKNYNGSGPGGAVFVDGAATVEDKSALNYYRDAGYTVSGKVQDTEDVLDHADPRDLESVNVGTRLRDAAVDPEPGDFLAPVNAGQANPHGPDVVSPEIHASGTAGIRPGLVVVDDVEVQNTEESAFAAHRLIDNATAGEAVAAVVPDIDDRGPIGLSDPGSTEVGVRDATGDTQGGRPSKNSSKADWVEYAVSVGADRGDVERSTKGALVETYGG